MGRKRGKREFNIPHPSTNTDSFINSFPLQHRKLMKHISIVNRKNEIGHMCRNISHFVHSRDLKSRDEKEEVCQEIWLSECDFEGSSRHVTPGQIKASKRSPPAPTFGPCLSQAHISSPQTKETMLTCSPVYWTVYIRVCLRWQCCALDLVAILQTTLVVCFQGSIHVTLL